MKAQSNEMPLQLHEISNGKWHYNFNVQQVEVEEMNGEGETVTRSAWEYDQITIKSAFTPTNENIRQLREEEYKKRSDSLYLAYQKYSALGETSKAESAKTAWLNEVQMIDMEFPYIN